MELGKNKRETLSNFFEETSWGEILELDLVCFFLKKSNIHFPRFQTPQVTLTKSFLFTNWENRKYHLNTVH